MLFSEKKYGTYELFQEYSTAKVAIALETQAGFIHLNVL